MKQKLINLAAQRTNLLEQAETALKNGDTSAFDIVMEQVSNLNTEIGHVQNLLTEQQRQLLERDPNPAEIRDMAEERGRLLMAGDAVRLTPLDVMRGFRNAGSTAAPGTTLATGALVEPTAVGTNIRDPLGNGVSSIVNQVYVQDLTGIGSLLEPYVLTELDAKGGKVTDNAGKARTASTSPTFASAKISPYEVNVTDYVDRNIARLSPANYYTKILAMALRAMRREVVNLIVNGDGQSSPDMYGIKTAKNTAGGTIYASAEVTKIDETLLDTLYFAYGSDEEIGANARLYLNKADLSAIGKVRNSDKQRVFKVQHDIGNANIGVIEDGGTIVPYTIVPGLTALSTATQGTAAIQTMLYGDPMNYELGLFGDYSIRVDESIKGVERMYTILGDVMVGGNLIVDKGFVVATLPAKAS